VRPEGRVGLYGRGVVLGRWFPSLNSGSAAADLRQGREQYRFEREMEMEAERSAKERSDQDKGQVLENGSYQSFVFSDAIAENAAFPPFHKEEGSGCLPKKIVKVAITSRSVLTIIPQHVHKLDFLFLALRSSRASPFNIFRRINLT